MVGHSQDLGISPLAEALQQILFFSEKSLEILDLNIWYKKDFQFFLSHLHSCFTFFLIDVKCSKWLYFDYEMSRVHWNLKINHYHDSQLKLPYHKLLHNLSLDVQPSHHLFKFCPLLLTLLCFLTSTFAVNDSSQLF
jgi:hypothetical protein